MQPYITISKGGCVIKTVQTEPLYFYMYILVAGIVTINPDMNDGEGVL